MRIDVAEWLESEPELWAREAHAATAENCRLFVECEAYPQGFIARNRGGNVIGVVTFSSWTGEYRNPYLIYVATDKAKAPKGTGFALFQAVCAEDPGSVIGARADTAEGEQALVRWGFRPVGDRWWKYDGPDLQRLHALPKRVASWLRKLIWRWG